jgi:hypothetical protein
MRRLDTDQQAYWIATAGRYALLDGNFVRGTTPQRLTVSQDSAPVELRDVDLDPKAPPGSPNFNAILVLKAPPLAGLDPARPVNILLDIAREKGLILPVVTHKTIALDYEPPSRYFDRPPKPLPEWLLAWKGRIPDLIGIGLALALLSVVLARPRWMTMSPRRQNAFRWGFLAFTLGFVGWYAQGQLSIVQITGAVKSLAAGQGLSSFLYDPVSLLLIAFTLVSFFVWGRGTFCGWLCPFGALQEFVGLLAEKLRLPRLTLAPALARRLENGRYVVLAVLVGCAIFAPQIGENLNEVEPFKTSITVAFDRGWPFVAYAAALLLAGAFYYKFFCRFICPLGGAMSLGGKLRRLDWLGRRSECGKPCQRCKAECKYDAIEPSGDIRYDVCFQCLDCVGIYHDKQRCVPIMLFDKKGRTLSPRGAGA